MIDVDSSEGDQAGGEEDERMEEDAGEEVAEVEDEEMLGKPKGEASVLEPP